jgi:hypothetical protein
MHKKIAIYVEGQTEHILIDHLIKTWWNFFDIRINNIKLVNDLKNPIPDFNVHGEFKINFLIINVEGLGSLNSAISQRANKQIDAGFEIIALRDLDDNNINLTEEISIKFKSALCVAGCKNFEKINLYFAIVTIEAWLLAFTKAVSMWANIPENCLSDQYQMSDLENIKNPAHSLETIAKKRGKKIKSHHEIMSLVSKIDREMFLKVFNSNYPPSFNRFWSKLLTLTETA